MKKSKSKTPSFITELPLKTTSADESTILVRLDAGRQLYHACLGEGLERLALIQQSKEYQEIQKLPKTIDGKQNTERTKAFNDLNRKHGFTDYALQHYATGIRNSWMEKHIHAHIAQKLATRAFKGVQKKAFGIAKNVRFKRKNQFDSLEGKNETGLIFKNNALFWSGLEIPCIIDPKNKVIAYGLNHKVKYCRIVRRKINGKNRFYLQLICEGTPYQNPKNKIGTEEIGLDVGTGTIAMVSDTKATLKQFCSELIPDQKKKRKLQRKLDRSLRKSNPDNYNKNGTVKKGKKHWIKSNRYKTTSQDLAETDRILAAHRKSLHGKDINEIIAMGTRIQTENVSYKGWQKRYGRSINMRAPSMFMNSLKIKAENAGGYLFEFPTQTTKLSQVCHICEQTVKKRLSKRWHICCGIRMQRDLYSAFLAKSVDQETSALDLARAKDLWQGMESILSDAISRAKQTAIGKACPASFGFNGIQSQSGSLVNPLRIISEAMDAVILPDESHRELI
jgi:putative transposase